MSHVVPLLPPFLTPHVARLASSSLAPRRVGTMRWHACVCRVDASIRPLVQLTSSPTAYGQMPSALPQRKAAATAMSLLCLAARVSTLALPPCQAVTSLSLSPCTGPRCPHVMRSYKQDLPVHFVPSSGFTVRRFRSTRSPQSSSQRCE
jgi:hypothetical protein